MTLTLKPARQLIGSTILSGMAVVMAATGAEAVSLNGTYSFTFFGNIEFTGTLDTTNVLTFPSQTYVVNAVPEMYFPFSGPGGINDFNTTVGDAVNGFDPGSNGTFTGNAGSGLELDITGITNTFSAVNLPNFLTWTSTSSPANRYSFSLTELRRESANPMNLNIEGIGTFSDAGGVYDNAVGSVTFSLSQVGMGQANFSASWAVPSAIEIPQTTPESSSVIGLGLLGGLGLLSISKKGKN